MLDIAAVYHSSEWTIHDLLSKLTPSGTVDALHMKINMLYEELRFDSRHGQRMFSLSQVPKGHKGPSTISNVDRGPHPRDKAAAARS